MSEVALEHHVIIKFLFKMGKTGTKIWEILVEVYGDSALKNSGLQVD
jgi:hypothetical protein